MRPSAISATGEPSPREVRRRRVLLALPIVGLAGLAAVLARGLSLDPSLVPTVLIGKPVPTFSLPPVQGRAAGLSSANLSGQVSLLNVFASWCVACREEHSFLMRLAKEGTIPIHGINYKDAPADAAAWLDSNGDPYVRIGADRDGRVAIDWGVYGVPETFVIGRAVLPSRPSARSMLISSSGLSGPYCKDWWQLRLSPSSTATAVHDR